MLNSLLQVSINGPAVGTPEAKEVTKKAVANWLQKKQRRLQVSNRDQLDADTTSDSTATPRPLLVDQGTQCYCDSSAALLNSEELQLMKEQLQEEVDLAKKTFFLLDHDSESDNDSVWDSMSESEDN